MKGSLFKVKVVKKKIMNQEGKVKKQKNSIKSIIPILKNF